MDSNHENDGRDRWARLRFAVVGPLLASPPPAGRLRAELERLAEREWEHPSGQGPVRFAVSTIERWYYQARAADNDPVGGAQAPAARRCRACAGDVGVADRGAARAVPGTSVVVGATAPREPGGAGRGRPGARPDAVLCDADAGDAQSRAGSQAPAAALRARTPGRDARGVELRGLAQPRALAYLMLRP